MTTPVPPPPKRAGRPPKPPEELYSAEHRVRLPRAQLARWKAAAKARGVRLADWTRDALDREADGTQEAPGRREGEPGTEEG